MIRTPGHTPGHVALYDPESKSLFTGDTLFRESIGRTDLPGGDYSWIMRSILDSLIPLGEEVHVYPGHGPESTIGHEMLYNPFIVEVLNEEVNYKNHEAPPRHRSGRRPGTIRSANHRKREDTDP